MGNETKKPQDDSTTSGVASSDLLAVIDGKIEEINHRKKKEYAKAKEANAIGQQLDEIEFELRSMRGDIEEILIG